MNKIKEIVVRIGDSCMLKDIYDFYSNFTNLNMPLIKETSVSFLQPEDNVFLGFVTLYDDNRFREYICCNSWRFVKDIDSFIYLRTSIGGPGFSEEKWEEIGDIEIKKLGILDRFGNSSYSEYSESLLTLSNYYKQMTRNNSLNQLGL